MLETIEVTAGLVPAFVALVLVMGGAVVAAAHRAARVAGGGGAGARRAALVCALALAAWLAATFGLASRGVLRFDTMPPTMIVLLVVVLAGSLTIGLSRVGARLALGIPLGLLVVAQGFRLPLELIMHQLYLDGLMPEQMSYSGLNYDVLTGLLAIPVGVLYAMGRLPLSVVRAWNVMGLLLLVNVLTIAVLSAPTPLRVFTNEPVNVWVTMVPWVWLPALLVPLALIGHVLVFRRLRFEERAGDARFEGRPAAVPAAAPRG